MSETLTLTFTEFVPSTPSSKNLGKQIPARAKTNNGTVYTVFPPIAEFVSSRLNVALSCEVTTTQSNGYTNRLLTKVGVPGTDLVAAGRSTYLKTDPKLAIRTTAITIAAQLVAADKLPIDRLFGMAGRVVQWLGGEEDA